MSLHYNILTPRKIRTLLKDVGHDCSLAGILNSELRVLKTLDYRICCNTPLLHVDTLLAMLDRFVASLKLDELRRVSIKLLDAAYLQQTELYNILFIAATGSSVQSKEDRILLTSVKQDTWLLTAGVIVSATYIVNPAASEKV
ncbi:PREDICTED: uncharacterized protein LOC106807812 isoform X2 [Priapulus caudatus]|nr:PREDICTED: uncharacterized protein LOC106807812 isoform X2 [Priapulus caudatus]